MADFHVKESLSDRQPFNRLLVRLKKEVIAFGVPGIRPAKHTSPKLKPARLKQWLDEGRPLTLLDVRNNYEVELGTFRNAMVAGIDNFRDFPAAVERIPESVRDQPIVMFCTGGIRCEKAGPFMEQAGFRNVFQLDGGILQYFEDCGSAHYQGDCFVFDQRVAVDPHLQETAAEVCFACQHVLRPADLKSPRYRAGQFCPFCYLTSTERERITLARRQQTIRQVTHPLPGSVPYHNYRPLNVPRRFDNYGLADFLDAFHPHVGKQVWLEKIRHGYLLLDDQPLKERDRVRAGQRIVHLIPATTEPDVATDIEILHEDAAIVVVSKPAPLPMHPSGRYNRNTLTWILGRVYEVPLRAAHRLDANTTGLVVFSKTRKIASRLQPQFQDQQVRKRYLAQVIGHPPRDEFVVRQPISDLPGLAGRRRVDDDGGKESVTRFRVVERFPNQTALVLAFPETGRTNQIRVHLWHSGHPVLGDPTYLPGGDVAESQTLSPGDHPMCLHADHLRFRHPGTGEVFEIGGPRPAWAHHFDQLAV